MKKVNFEKVVWEKKKLSEKHKERKTCKIYLFRHAQTHYNKRHMFTGHKDSQLTPFGIKQAKLVANKLKYKQIDVAFRTHLSRSKDTLKEILKFHPEIFMLVEDDRMIERSYGELEGKSHNHMQQVYGHRDYLALLHAHKVHHLHGKERIAFEKEHGSDDLHIVRRSYNKIPRNGESVKMVEKRVLAFIKDLLKFIKQNKVNVAISAHGNSMRPFRRYFEKMSIDEMMKIENPWDDYFEYEVKL